MVVIRLSRAGAKKRPFYHIVVTDSRRRQGGSCIERIGYFNPLACGEEVRLHIEIQKVIYWKKVGAKWTERVHALLREYYKNNESPA